MKYFINSIFSYLYLLIKQFKTKFIHKNMKNMFIIIIHKIISIKNKIYYLLGKIIFSI
jgi:hypothetical protein